MNSADILVESFADFWSQFTSFIPTILLAIVLLFAGFLLAWFFEGLTKKILRTIGVEKAYEKVGLKSMFEKGGMKMSLSRLVGSVVYWFILIVFLSSVARILNLGQISDFLNSLVGYLPNVIAAIAIMIIGILVGNVLSNVVRDSSNAARIESANFLSNLTKWAIFIFALLAALSQLQIAGDLIRILFAGIVVMLALAGGLAFGLGGKDTARDILEKIKK